MLFFKNQIFLYSLVTIIILILFHLIKRKNIKEVEFSSIIFILKSHKKISKKLKVKEILLFLFRLIILISIILLITNTSMQEKQDIVSSKSKNQKIIVLDNNYQMLMKIGSKNDLQNAKELIKKYFQGNSNTNSIFFKNEQYTISSISQLNEILDKINITYDYKKSTIYNFLENKDKFKGKEIIIISNYRDLINGSNFKYSLIKHTNIDNQYIKEMNIRRIEFNRYKVTTKIKSASSKEKTKTITLYLKNKKISSSIFIIKPNETKEITISFTLPSKEENLIKELEYKIELEGDDLNYDNKKFFIINRKKPKEILIVNGAMSTISYQDEAFYLENALNSNEEKYKFNLTQKSWITSKSIKQYDLIIFLNNVFDDYDNQYAVNEFLKSGKSVFISLGENTNKKDFNYFWTDIISLRNFKNLEKTKKYKFINTFNYDFSFLKKITFVKNQLASYPIYKYFNLNVKQGVKVMVSLNDGTPFLAEKILEKGKLIISTSTLDRDWNDFPLSTNYAPLMIATIKYLLKSKQEVSLFYINDISKLKELKLGSKNKFKTAIYQHKSKIAYNTLLNRSNISFVENKEDSVSLKNNNLLIPLKNYFIMVFLFMIFLETLFFVKRFLWNEKKG